jgi:hypothetical protein
VYSAHPFDSTESSRTFTKTSARIFLMRSSHALAAGRQVSFHG